MVHRTDNDQIVKIAKIPMELSMVKSRAKRIKGNSNSTERPEFVSIVIEFFELSMV
jgi:hypothetical protein